MSGGTEFLRRGGARRVPDIGTGAVTEVGTVIDKGVGGGGLVRPKRSTRESRFGV